VSSGYSLAYLDPILGPQRPCPPTTRASSPATCLAPLVLLGFQGCCTSATTIGHRCPRSSNPLYKTSFQSTASGSISIHLLGHYTFQGVWLTRMENVISKAQRLLLVLPDGIGNLNDRGGFSRVPEAHCHITWPVETIEGIYPTLTVTLIPISEAFQHMYWTVTNNQSVSLIGLSNH
jgi:hypothetical protein